MYEDQMEKAAAVSVYSTGDGRPVRAAVRRRYAGFCGGAAAAAGTAPAWLFPVVWTLLYLLMGLAAYLVLTGGTCRQRREAMVVYGAQLAVNFFWSVLFFTFKAYLLALVWLVLLWGLIVLTIWRFAAVRPLAGWLLVPYLLWVTFAGYLNFGVFLLN